MKDKVKQQQVQQEPASAQEALAPELSGLRAPHIAALAHSRAQRRGFSRNRTLDNGPQAEREIDSAEEALVAD